MPADPHPDRPGLSLRQALGGHDLPLLVAALGASTVGALLVWSATHQDAGSTYLVRHLVNTGLGLGLALGVSRVGRNGIRHAAPWVYLASLAGLAAVLTPLGATINGSRSWIPLMAGFTLQPSEFAKVGVTLLVAGLFADRVDRRVAPGARDVLLAWVVAFVPVGLVMLQPDLGSAVVLLALAFVVILVAGAPWRWVLGVLALAGAAIAVVLTSGVLSGYQQDRLLVFLDPARDPLGAGYQLAQVRIAVTGGGWWGQGFMEGRQTQGGFIPFQLNDFIFSVAGEELGFVGSAGLLVLLGFVILRIAVVGARSTDAFGRFVAAGATAWLAFQVFQNVGMTLGLVPVTGLPLPFISYGGSSMFATWLMIGVVDAAQAHQWRAPLLR